MTCKPEQIRKLMKNSKTKTLEVAGVSENTVRKYVRRREKAMIRHPRQYRTRQDPFIDVWDEMSNMLEADPGLKAKTLMEWLIERQPERLHSLQRADGDD